MDITKMTDKEIIDLTTVTFTTNDGKSVSIPLDDVRILDAGSVDISGTIYKFKTDEINKIVLKKGKYNLAKGNIDITAVNDYVNTVVVDFTGKLMEKYANTLQLNAETLEQATNEVKQTMNSVNISISEMRRGNEEIQKSHSKLENSVSKVMQELKVLIEE